MSNDLESKNNELIENISPGIYPDIPNEIYHKLKAISRSDIVKANVSIAHYEQAKLVTFGSKAMDFGSLVHDAIMFPELVEKYAFEPKCDKRTKAGKEIYKEFVENNVGKIIVAKDSTKDHPPEIALQMIMANIEKSDFVKRFFNKEYCKFEHSIIWTDKVTGLKCKCRPDILMVDDNTAFVIDIKTCQDASERDFRYSLRKFNYHVQGSYYSEGVKSVLGVDKVVFLYIAIETKAPYGIAVYDLHKDTIEKTNKIWRKGLLRFKKYKDDNIVESYPEKIITINLNDWEI